MKTIITKIKKPPFIPVDEWVYSEEDIIIKQTDGYIFVPISRLYGLEEESGLDCFKLKPKRSYAREDVRLHLERYLNYFLKFYDEDKELISIYAQMKYLIDCVEGYDLEAFKFDIKKYILSGSLFYKIKLMNRDNVLTGVSVKEKSHLEKSLQYNNTHIYKFMQISLCINIVIPLLTHFMAKNNITHIDTTILSVYDVIIRDLTDDIVDIYSKLYETCDHYIRENQRYNKIWGNQDIRGINATTHVDHTVNGIITNAFPEYVYNQNLISYNFAIIKQSIVFRVTKCGYEYDFKPLSSSKKDEDDNSEFDKFENYLVKQNEALYLQNKVNCSQTMENLENIFGPFDEKEINFYIDRLSEDNKIVINKFQKKCIFNLFYKYFGDTTSIYSNNINGYIKLMLIARKILEANKMIILPYVISSKILKVVNRKKLNKEEENKLMSSPYYPIVMNEYNHNPKIKQDIVEMLATILASDFEIIDYHDEKLDGVKIENIPDILMEELLMYITLIWG